MMHTPNAKAFRPVPDGWLTAARYRHLYGGNNQRHNEHLAQTYEKLIEHMMNEQQLTKKEATEAISATLIGWFHNEKNQVVLAASKQGWEAVRTAYPRMPEPVHFIELHPPKLSADWQTARQYTKGHQGSYVNFQQQLEALQHNLIGSIKSSTGCSEDEARILTKTHLVGLRSTYNKHLTLAGSPDAWRLIADANPPPIPTGWITARAYKFKYGGNNQQLNMRLSDTLIALIDKQMTAEGCTAQEAADELAKTHIGIFTSERGHEVLAASHEGWQEVIKRTPKMHLPPGFSR